MQQPRNGILQSLGPSLQAERLESAPRRPRVEARLPDKDVSENTIEDAYVSFILYCNPAVPADTESALLREAFLTPPRSGGKVFGTFALFDLVRRLDAREIKTWADLVLRLGVDPPDQVKGQSSQKIPQYAARLKRWMKSMHIDAFFEYLLKRAHPYWVDIPADSDHVVCEGGRDGVLAEDDMALRSLIPHLRPKRGRRRVGEDDAIRSSSQRPRLESPAAFEDTPGPWSAHPDSRTPTGNSSLASAYPYSAVTPSIRGSFWADPTGTLTPTATHSSRRRHGAKVVSSAWRHGATTSAGRGRGRPPASRLYSVGNGTPLSASPLQASLRNTVEEEEEAEAEAKVEVEAEEEEGETDNGMDVDVQDDDNGELGNEMTGSSQSKTFSTVTSKAKPDPAYAPEIPTFTPPIPSFAKPARFLQVPTPTSMFRPVKPSITLQVPERVGGSVRLATPPLSLPLSRPMRNASGRDQHKRQQPPHSQFPLPNLEHPLLLLQDSVASLAPAESPPGFFKASENGANLIEVHDLLVLQTLHAAWVDVNGQPEPPCALDEAAAVSEATMEIMRRAAPSDGAFLNDLAALLGARALAPPSSDGSGGVRMVRLGEAAGLARYRREWSLCLGGLHGEHAITVEVARPWVSGHDGNQGQSASRTAELLATAARRQDQTRELELRIVAALRSPSTGV